MSPTMFFWYKWLDGKFVGTAIKTVAKKCILDQFLMTPNLLAIFYVSMSLLEGKSDLTAELRKKFVPTFIVSIKYFSRLKTMENMHVCHFVFYRQIPHSGCQFRLSTFFTFHQDSGWYILVAALSYG